MALQLITGIATAAALGAGSLVAGVAAAQHEPQLPCGAVWQQLPESLRDDLTDRRTMTPEQRGPALRELRREALEGGSGPGVQQRAERWVAHRDGHRAWVRTRVPAQLRRDVHAALGLAPDERHDALAAVRDRALAGGYGDRVQAVAEAMQQRRETCGAVAP
ncbi:MAG: hypothetical protein R2731_09260 [Nocardioides sp.]